MLNPFREIYYFVKSSFRCVGAYTKWLRTGSRYADFVEVHHRTKTCVSCPIRIGEKCGDGETVGCGCILTEKIKLKDECCPIGKW